MTEPTTLWERIMGTGERFASKFRGLLTDPPSNLYGDHAALMPMNQFKVKYDEWKAERRWDA